MYSFRKNIERAKISKARAPKSLNNVEKKTYDQMKERVEFAELTYTTNLIPSLYFFKFLCIKSTGNKKKDFHKEGKLRLFIPDTLVFNDGSKSYSTNHFWIYSSIDGFVFRTEDFNELNTHMKFGNFLNVNEVVAIQKTVRFNTKLFTSFY